MCELLEKLKELKLNLHCHINGQSSLKENDAVSRCSRIRKELPSMRIVWTAKQLDQLKAASRTKRILIHTNKKNKKTETIVLM